MDDNCFSMFRAWPNELRLSSTCRALSDQRYLLLSTVYCQTMLFNWALISAAAPTRRSHLQSSTAARKIDKFSDNVHNYGVGLPTRHHNSTLLARNAAHPTVTVLHGQPDTFAVHFRYQSIFSYKPAPSNVELATSRCMQMGRFDTRTCSVR